jgi:hypothetical protein
MNASVNRSNFVYVESRGGLSAEGVSELLAGISEISTWASPVSSIQSFQILSPQIHTLVAPSACPRESFDTCENCARHLKKMAPNKNGGNGDFSTKKLNAQLTNQLKYILKIF